ncbi:MULTISPECIES: hypothetical protein [Streptomyces]|uniref:Uncharacterized protein n=1 Tax=Streptomyces galilaeus TaxID=33899 RepID=A0ABW9IVY8_STRGJ
MDTLMAAWGPAGVPALACGAAAPGGLGAQRDFIDVRDVARAVYAR